MPRLSIVIPSHNRPDLLAACLESIQRHAPPATEVIVVDDGSIEGVISRTAMTFVRTRVVRNVLARGFCISANRGVEAAQSPIVHLLNDDTEVHPGWAEAALAPFEDPRVGAVSPLVLRATVDGSPPSHIDSAGDGYFMGGVAFKRYSGCALAKMELRPENVFGANGTASFFRREAYLGVGGMPEAFGAYFDDVDLSFRLHRAGYRVRFEPGSRLIHRVASSYGKPRGELLAQQSRNEELVFWRNVRLHTLPLALPLHLGVLGLKALLRLREGTLGPFLWGRAAAFCIQSRRDARSVPRPANAIGPRSYNPCEAP